MLKRIIAVNSGADERRLTPSRRSSVSVRLAQTGGWPSIFIRDRLEDVLTNLVDYLQAILIECGHALSAPIRDRACAETNRYRAICDLFESTADNLAFQREIGTFCRLRPDLTVFLSNPEQQTPPTPPNRPLPSPPFIRPLIGEELDNMSLREDPGPPSRPPTPPPSDQVSLTTNHGLRWGFRGANKGSTFFTGRPFTIILSVLERQPAIEVVITLTGTARAKGNGDQRPNDDHVFLHREYSYGCAGDSSWCLIPPGVGELERWAVEIPFPSRTECGPKSKCWAGSQSKPLPSSCNECRVYIWYNIKIKATTLGVLSHRTYDSCITVRGSPRAKVTQQLRHNARRLLNTGYHHTIEASVKSTAASDIGGKLKWHVVHHSATHFKLIYTVSISSKSRAIRLESYKTTVVVTIASRMRQIWPINGGFEYFECPASAIVRGSADANQSTLTEDRERYPRGRWTLTWQDYLLLPRKAVNPIFICNVQRLFTVSAEISNPALPKALRLHGTVFELDPDSTASGTRTTTSVADTPDATRSLLESFGSIQSSPADLPSLLAQAPPTDTQSCSHFPRNLLGLYSLDQALNAEDFGAEVRRAAFNEDTAR